MNLSRFIVILYFFVVLGCVGVSTWSTYYGYERLLGLVALPVAVLIGLLLMLCDVAILKFWREGKLVSLRFLGVVFFLLLFTALSWAANFNYFYTNFMRDRLVEQTAIAASDRFDQNMRLAETTVGRNASTLDQDVNDLLRRLKDEVHDPLNRGFGSKAKAVIEEIYARLAAAGIKVQPVRLPPEGAPSDQNERTLTEINRRVTEAIKGAPDPLAKARGVIEEAKGRQAASINSLAALAHTPKAAGTQLTFARIEAMAKWMGETGQVEGWINQKLEEAKKTDRLNHLQTIPANEQELKELELNSIPATIKSGFYDRPDPKSTALAAAVAVAIDIFPLLVAILAGLVVPLGGVPAPTIGSKPVTRGQLRVIGGRRSLAA